MEMTNRRWVALVITSCLIIAAGRLPPRSRPARGFGTPAEHASDRVAQLKTRITALHEAAVVIARRDSLLAVLSQADSRPRPLIVRLAKPTPVEDAIIQRAVDAQARALGAAAENLVLAVVRDTVSSLPVRVNYRTDRQFLLPSAIDGKTCITVLRLARARPGLEPAQREGIFGPCAFYASFGSPGTAVEAWLRQREHDVALSAAWPPRSQPDPARMQSRRLTSDEELRMWLGFDRGFRVPLEISACSSGDAAFCARALRTPEVRATAVLPGLVVRESFASWFDSQLGTERQSFLSDLLATHGRAKFEKFWKSSGDLETAFTNAFGESTGKWTMRWMQYRYGKDTRGPAVAWVSALRAIIISIAFVGLFAVAAHRREAL